MDHGSRKVRVASGVEMGCWAYWGALLKVARNAKGTRENERTVNGPRIPAKDRSGQFSFSTEIA